MAARQPKSTELLIAVSNNKYKIHAAGTECSVSILYLSNKLPVFLLSPMRILFPSFTYLFLFSAQITNARGKTSIDSTNKLYSVISRVRDPPTIILKSILFWNIFYFLHYVISIKSKLLSEHGTFIICSFQASQNSPYTFPLIRVFQKRNSYH